MTGREKFSKIKPMLNILGLIFKVFPYSFCQLLWHIIMPFNGNVSKTLRFLILKSKAKNVGDNLSIGANTIIKKWNNFSCGNNVSIHENCMIDCTTDIIIHNNVSIAHSTSMVAANHTWEDKNIPIKYNPITSIGIIIYDDVWVGCGVRILDGVTLNKRSIVAAGAVVNKSFDNNSLIGGVPAKLIKNI